MYKSCKTGRTTSANVLMISVYMCSPALLPTSCSRRLCVSRLPYLLMGICVCVCVCTVGGEACVCQLMALREDAQQQWSLQLVSLPPHTHELHCGVISHCPDKWVTICTGSICVCVCVCVFIKNTIFMFAAPAVWICVGNICRKCLLCVVCV